MSAANAERLPGPLVFAGPIGSHGVDVCSARPEDLFDAWVCAARDAELSLSAWTSSTSSERGVAHAVYRPALDREECAAAVPATAACS